MDTKTLFTVILVAGIVGGFALNNSLFNATIEVGAEAPDFTLMDPDGNEFSLSDFEGEKVVVLEFMNMSCGTCKNFEENSLRKWGGTSSRVRRKLLMRSELIEVRRLS